MYKNKSRSFLNNEWINVEEHLPYRQEVVQVKLNNGDTIFAVRELSDSWRQWFRDWETTVELNKFCHRPKFWRLIDREHTEQTKNRKFAKINPIDCKDWENLPCLI